MEETDLLKAYNNIYLEIIMRYRDHIEEKEALYLADLPQLVTPEDESVMLLANEVKSNFPAYLYNENFPEAAKLAYDYVRNRIAPVSIPIQFWLRPAQTIKYGAGDLFDKAVLLCSVLIALGDPASRVVVITKGSERHFIAYSEYQGRTLVMDVENGVREFKSLDALVNEMQLGEDDDSAAYEFNDKMYRNIV